MKKRFTLKGVDCANCAAKMEEGIRGLDGVEDVSISFLTQKMTLQAEDSRFEEILEQAAAVCRRVDRHCTIER